MFEVLITLRHLNTSHPVTVGEFKWHEATGRHLMQGRPFSVEEFNAWTHSPEWDRSIERNGERLCIELREVIDSRVTELEAQNAELLARIEQLSAHLPSAEGVTGGAPAPLAQSQDGQVAKSSGSYPEVAGSTPAPATTTDLLKAAANATPPAGRRRRENTRANSRGRNRNG